ncbi:hypothetical protein G5I_09075 [Acromyrmex echinatior]|uniref:Uncharacterized protein n=1 Tax=Acromyrmex echinatior TaxID=103372 RepID=F4WT72_ACREC|nr:hypothetical protein G5I_09075 [Acromyrmex echinatior]
MPTESQLHVSPEAAPRARLPRRSGRSPHHLTHRDGTRLVGASMPRSNPGLHVLPYNGGAQATDFQSAALSVSFGRLCFKRLIHGGIPDTRKIPDTCWIGPHTVYLRVGASNAIYGGGGIA